MNLVIITIPLYKPTLNNEELKSLRRCFEILSNHPISFFGPENLDVTFYQNFCSENKIDFVYKKFSDEFFKDRFTYSHLLVSPEFYQKYTDYKFLLLYQTDAYVFRNDLKYWCEQDYDYIGAPWFLDNSLDENAPILKYAGNGGFSLRKISTHLQVLKKAKKVRYHRISRFLRDNFKNKNGHNFFKKITTSFKQYFSSENSFAHFVTHNKIEEDIVWITKVPKRVMKIKIAPPNIAMYFSFDLQARRLFKMTNQTLPFGCHAFFIPDNKKFWIDEIGAIEK